MRLLRWRRGVSPLLATIILIAITVAAGLVIYNLFFSTSGTISASLQVEITSVDLINASSKVLFSVTVKNTGNKPIDKCNVTIWDEGGYPKPSSGYQFPSISSTNTLDSGEYASVTLTESIIGSNFVRGKTYPVKVSAWSGSEVFEKIVTVVCSG